MRSSVVGFAVVTTRNPLRHCPRVPLVFLKPLQQPAPNDALLGENLDEIDFNIFVHWFEEKKETGKV